MPKRIHTSLILVAVFALGIIGGVMGMVWAWPGLRAHYFPHQHSSPIQYFQRSLHLTAAQVPQVQAILQETGKRGDAIHAEFIPQYTKICEEITQVRAQERNAFVPLRQEELDKIHAVLTPQQWATFQQQRTAAMNGQPHNPQDACKHMGEGPPPGGPGRGHGPGRGGRGRGSMPPPM